jgi:hypothetical protein
VAPTASSTAPASPPPRRQLLPEAAGHQQRVVDAEPEPEEGCEVEDEDAHRDRARDQEHRAERDDHRRAADDQRHGGRDRGAEDNQERDRGQWQRDELAPSQVGLGDRLDVAVEGRPAGQSDLQARRVPERGAQARQRLRRVVRGQVQ